MLCALIMAGGKGTRFWPLSTEEKPKQFLNLIGEKTMLQMTVERVLPIIPIERVFVCTGEVYVDLVKEQLPELPEKNIIVEPEGRNTAPCIALSSLVIKRYYKDATVAVLPSDHLVRNEEKFRSILVEAENYLASNNEAIITLGMTPSRVETGYGYIKEGNERKTKGSCEIVDVKAFVEKPNKEKAELYISEGNYLWNGGMFVWKLQGIINNIKELLPNTYEALSSVELVEECRLQQLINERYSKTDSISVDYGILEKANKIYVIPSDIGWDDVGSWEALDRYREKDEQQNVCVGNAKVVDGSNNLIISSGNSVVVEGLSDIYVIEHEGKILVGKKSNVANVKELKKIIK